MMTKAHNFLLLIATLYVFSGCTSEEFDPTITDTLIVEGYLYANAPIDNIKISQLIPFIQDDEDTDYKIDDAEVFLIYGEEKVLLDSHPDSAGTYVHPNQDYLVEQGLDYQIQLGYYDKSITSQTLVPNRPEGLQLSSDTLTIAPITSFDQLANIRDLEPVEVNWDNSSSNSYYILIENIESNPQDINQLNFGGNFNFSRTTPPTNLDFYNIRPNELTQYGTYRIIIYRVGPEYVDLYETAEADSRNLSEPVSNIENGLGIFTSFNSDTTYLYIKPE